MTEILTIIAILVESFWFLLTFTCQPKILTSYLNAPNAKKVWQPLPFELFPYNYQYCCAQIGINSFDSVFVESDAKSYAFESFCKVQPDWINLVVKKNLHSH